jgi:hypothetical protein
MYQRETFLEHYHKRSNVESVFYMVKGKFGDSVRSKSDVGQVNEVLCKVLCHNRLRAYENDRGLGEAPIQECRSLAILCIAFNVKFYARCGD